MELRFCPQKTLGLNWQSSSASIQLCRSETLRTSNPENQDEDSTPYR